MDWCGAPCTDTPYLYVMGEANPNKRRKTTRRQIALDDPLWDRLGELYGDRGRSEKIRQLVEWHLRMPGAKMPERPPRAD